MMNHATSCFLVTSSQTTVIDNLLPLSFKELLLNVQFSHVPQRALSDPVSRYLFLFSRMWSIRQLFDPCWKNIIVRILFVKIIEASQPWTQRAKQRLNKHQVCLSVTSHWNSSQETIKRLTCPLPEPLKRCLERATPQSIFHINKELWETALDNLIVFREFWRAYIELSTCIGLTS